jgi:hypothetical protein
MATILQLRLRGNAEPHDGFDPPVMATRRERYGDDRSSDPIVLAAFDHRSPAAQCRDFAATAPAGPGSPNLPGPYGTPTHSPDREARMSEDVARRPTDLGRTEGRWATGIPKRPARR